MIKACIFDLDGVIVDTARYHFLAWKRLAVELGIPFTEADNERLKGVSRLRSMEILLELGHVTMARDEQERLANKKNGWFVEYVERMTPAEIFPGVPELLKDLRRRGQLIGLASSSKNAPRVIELLGLAQAFDAIVDGTMIVHTKPDPEIFLLAAHTLNVAPHQCVVFEDAEAGVASALAAGMACIGIGSKEQLYRADRVLATTGAFDPAMLATLDVRQPRTIP